jgi:hypothetical protein
MPAVQTQFNAFHSAIKLDIDDEKATLQAKRDTLLRALDANLPKDAPAYTSFHQGSYSMHTGVVPLNGNYDIDVGIIFDCERSAYPDPVVLKKIVRDALDTHGRTVNIRRPCVTVNYMTGDVTNYHVDLAIYAQRSDGLLDLAKGKEHSATEHRIWETSNPKELTKLICGRFSDAAELAQYRRCIRYMKRWRDYQFLKGGPLSIAITVAAYRWFQPKKAATGTYLDLEALLAFVESMLAEATWQMHDEGPHKRLSVPLLVTPYGDLTAKMSKTQMESFLTALQNFRDALVKAYNDPVPEDACKVLAGQFGTAFPIPEKADTAKAVRAPVVHTGNSA